MRRGNVPKTLKRGVNIIRLPLGGRIHNILYLCTINGGTTSWITIPGTQFSSKHIARVEIYNLVRRNQSYSDQSKGLTFTITPQGEQAYNLLQDEMIKYLGVDRKEFIIQCAIGSKQPYVKLPPGGNSGTGGWTLLRLYPILRVKLDIVTNDEAFNYHLNRVW